MLAKKKKEAEEQRKMFEDKSLNWVPRELDNSRWVGLNNWTATRDNFKWHQLQENYNIPVDLIFPEDVEVPSYKVLPYKEARSDEEKKKEEENA